MTIAAFILSVLGFGVGVASLTWQVYTFLMQGARPELTPVIGIHYGHGYVTNDATRDVRESLRSAAAQLPRGLLIIGVKVVNAGRAPFHVARWALRSDPAGTSFVSVEIPIGCPEVPYDIAPGAEAIFFTDLDKVRGLTAASAAIDGRPQRLVATVTSGGRTFTSKPIHTPMLIEGTR